MLNLKKKFAFNVVFSDATHLHLLKDSDMMKGKNLKFSEMKLNRVSGYCEVEVLQSSWDVMCGVPDRTRPNI